MPARNRLTMSLTVKQFLLPSFCEYSRFKILNHVLCSRSPTWGITLCQMLYILRVSQWKRGSSLSQSASHSLLGGPIPSLHLTAARAWPETGSQGSPFDPDRCSV